MEIKVGCCGFPTAKERYFKNFDVVEIQQTFYQPPEIKTATKWRELAPEDFEFTLKAWQLITHEPKSPTYRKLGSPIPESKKKNYGGFKPTEDVFKAWEKTEEIARKLKAKYIIFQSPASFQPTSENMNNMKKFFKKIKAKNYILTWEPRGKWESNDLKSLSEELGLLICLDPFKTEPFPQKTSYFRLHGKEGYRYKYTDSDLRFLKDICEDYQEVHVMFNNVYMFDDALRFKKLIT